LAFLRVVEVFPPLFSQAAEGGSPLRTKARVDEFVKEVDGLRRLADVVLVADVKNPRLLKVSALEAALMLKNTLRVDAAPVLVVRDLNRPQFLSSVLTGVAFGLKSMMIAWGDRHPAAARSTNVRDFPDLAHALREASRIRRRARSSAVFFAPVDVDGLAGTAGRAVAERRVKAGADYLLAQPPTTDAQGEFERHASLVQHAGLEGKVLLNVFPFRGKRDVRECERYFGWRLPRSIHRTAARGASELLASERAVVRRLERDGFPGVYLSSRGIPGLAASLLA
jgi:5,10-methylenetetrahydrofolate reductase